MTCRVKEVLARLNESSPADLLFGGLKELRALTGIITYFW